MSTNAQLVKILPLSQSRFEDLACSLLYRAKHVEGIREPGNEYSLRGTQVHEGVSDYTRYLVRRRLTSDADWFNLNILSRCYLPDALEILRDMMEWFTVEPEQVLATELYLALDQDFQPLETTDREEYCEQTGRYPDYEGTLDLLQILTPRHARIDDVKTFFRIVDADTFQSKLYPLLAFQHFPDIEEITFGLDFVRYGAFAKREVVYTRSDVPKLQAMAREARLRQIELHIDAAPHEAMPGDHCAYCPRLRTCPLGESNHMTEDPKDVLRQALWAQALLKQATAILEAHAALGELTVTDGNGNKFAAGFHEKTSRSYPLSVVPLVNANDPELAKKLTVSGLSTPLSAKKRKALADLVMPLAEIKVSTKFTIGTDKDEAE